MLQQFLQKLNEPFPEPGDPKPLGIDILCVGLFIALFLYLLKPFGISESRGDVFIFCLGFGVVTIVIGVLYEWISLRLLNIRKDLPSWTLLKWIGSSILLILFIAIGNFLYLNWINGYYFWTWTFFWQMVYNTLLVGIIPTVFAGLSIQLRAIKANQNNAQNLQAQLPSNQHDPHQLLLHAQNQKQNLELQTDALFFIESMQNYVAIHHLDGESVKKTLLRNTIANITNQLSNSSIIRCHRSYLVNIDLIEQVAGNAQGLRLQLKGLPGVEIPVSRKYISTLRQQLETSKS